MMGFAMFATISGVWVAGNALLLEIFPYSKNITLTKDTLDSPASKIKRNDSEYSLVLSRSKSFDDIATTLGEFCSSGQVLVSVSQYLCVVATAIVIGIQMIGYIDSTHKSR